MNILVNLAPGFFTQPELKTAFDRLERLGEVRRRSHETAEELQPDLAWAEAVIMWSWPPLTGELLDSAPGLRYAGHIDIGQAAARTALARGLPVSLSRHGFSPAVAEMALGLILGTLRRVSDYHAEMRRGDERWVRSFPADVDPLQRELTGRSVGLVGFGNVGRRLAELLEPFRCDLRVVDPFVPEEMIQKHHARRVEMPEMLSSSDVVVICAASNPGSRHLIGAEEIAMLRADAVFVNVARAALVDMMALVERLKQGHLFAALDVFDREPLDRDSLLRSLPNVYLTPHRAGGIIASVVRIFTYLVDDLENVTQGRPQQYPLRESMIPTLDG